MFTYGAEESTVTASNLERLAKWAKKANVKAKSAIASAKAIKSVAKDIRQAVKPQTLEQIAEENAKLEASYSDEIYGIPSTYVYVGAGLLIVAGIGYIVYNRMK